MLKGIVLVAFMIFCFPSAASMTSKDENKDHEITEILSYVAKIQSIAQRNKSIKSNEVLNEVKRVIPASLHSIQVWKIGTISGAFFHPGSASHSEYDEAYYQAEKYCATLLSKRCDSDSKYYLSSMKSQFGKDGGESLIYNNLLSNQTELCK